MPVNGTTSTQGALSTGEYYQRKPVQELGRNEFLSLLAAQLSNQDPLEPVKDTDFISQMATFSSLQQMEALNTNFISNQAFGLVGKTVFAEVTPEGTYTSEPVLGKVDSVFLSNGEAFLKIGNTTVPMNSVGGVLNEDFAPQADEASRRQLLQASGHIGYHADLTIDVGEGQQKQVDGKITGLMFVEGQLMLELDAKTYVAFNIIKQYNATKPTATTGETGGTGETAEETTDPVEP